MHISVLSSVVTGIALFVMFGFHSFIAANNPAGMPIEWIALQQGTPANQEDPPGLTIQREKFSNFLETARAMATLDLVITIDTCTAHLAGAIGLPVWILLPSDPDLRWPREGSSSDLYPTATLFRQPEPGDWYAVAETVADDLKAL